MSVRGTSHGQVNKRIINLDKGGTFVVCAWDTCDKDAITLYEVRNHTHPRSIPCEYGEHWTLAFCSERHKQYHLACSGPMALETQERNRGRVAGMLPPGWKKDFR